MKCKNVVIKLNAGMFKVKVGVLNIT